VPSVRPVAAKEVLVLAEVIDTWFHTLSAAPVILARFDTVTDDRTKYAVPVSVLDTDAEPDDLIVAAVNVTVGAIVSLVIVVEEAELADGPVFPATSDTPFIDKRGWIVPSEQADTVTVYDEPEPDTAKEQPADPAFAKSPSAKPETAASNVSEYAIDDALLGEETDEVNDDTDGAVVSIVTVVEADDDETLPAGSVCLAVTVQVPSVKAEMLQLDGAEIGPAV
jgi:hypothetical protein